MRPKSAPRPAMLLLLVACGVVTLAGCGQKGPLYLPDPAENPATNPTDEAGKKDGKKQDPPPPAATRRAR